MRRHEQLDHSWPVPLWRGGRLISSFRSCSRALVGSLGRLFGDARHAGGVDHHDLFDIPN